MRRAFAFLGAMLAASTVSAAAIQSRPAIAVEASPSMPRRRRSLYSAAQAQPRYRQSRRPAHRRQLRANRLHVSKRTRRRIRRRRAT